MANFWEPFLVGGPTKEGSVIAVTVEFRKDGESTISDTWQTARFSLEWLKNQARSKCEALNAEIESVAIGKIDTTLPASPVVDTLAEAWEVDFNRYDRAIRVSRFKPGILQLQKFKDLEQRLNDGFKAAYLDLG